jgi:hypothetical protein
VVDFIAHLGIEYLFGDKMLVLDYPRRQSVAFSDKLLELYELATKTTDKEIYFNPETCVITVMQA